MKLFTSLKITPDLALASDFGFLPCTLRSVLTYGNVAQGPMQNYQTVEVLRLLQTTHDVPEPERAKDLRAVFQAEMPAAS